VNFSRFQAATPILRAHCTGMAGDRPGHSAKRNC